MEVWNMSFAITTLLNAQLRGKYCADEHLVVSVFRSNFNDLFWLFMERKVSDGKRYDINAGLCVLQSDCRRAITFAIDVGHTSNERCNV